VAAGDGIGERLPRPAFREAIKMIIGLVTVSPAQGYGVQRQDTDPDDHARVIFAGGAGGRIEVDVRCRSGQPTISWKPHD
jgi:hypothetical protein